MNPFSDHDMQKKAGTGVAILMFVLTLSALNSIGLVPDYVDGTGTFAKERPFLTVQEVLPNEREEIALSDVPRLGDVIEVLPPLPLAASAIVRPLELPTTLSIPRVKITVPVLNPDTTNANLLDTALAKGVVRYTLSSELNEDGNMFIFGHSSHLPVVKNKMYKALNGIETLVRGDSIFVTGKSGEVHEYQVTSVKKTDANDELIDLSVHTGVRKLTLSTCDSFGKKSSRFVVEAEFVKVRE